MEAARKEGRVVWLTTQVLGELALPLAAAFKAAYGIEVTAVRTTSRQTAEQLVQSARNPQSGIDVVDGRSAIPQLKRAGLLAPLDIPATRDMPPEHADRDGYWVASNMFFNAIVVNTERIPLDRRPQKLDDLLRPEWSGRMVWSGQSTLSAGTGFIGALLRDRGEADGRTFLERLGQQQITSLDVPSRQIVETVIAGQFDVGLQVFHHQAAISAASGAQIAWLPVEPLTASVTAVGVTRQSPRPRAARLFVEFLLSRQGQEIFREADHIPVSAEVAPKDPTLRPPSGRFRTVTFSPEEVEVRMPEWQALRGELFK